MLELIKYEGNLSFTAALVKDTIKNKYFLYFARVKKMEMEMNKEEDCAYNDKCAKLLQFRNQDISLKIDLDCSKPFIIQELEREKDYEKYLSFIKILDGELNGG